MQRTRRSPADHEPGDGLSRHLRWLIGIRLLVITSVVLPYFLLQLSRPDAPELTFEALYVVAGLTYAASLVYIALARLLRGHETTQAYVQFVGDLLLISGLVYALGGITSPFAMLYLIIIAVASAMLRKRAGTSVATIAYTLYASTLLAIYFHWLPNPGGFVAETPSVWRLTYNLAVSLFGFYAVALLTTFLAEGVSQVEQELEEKSESLADLEIVHHDVIQSMSGGLITIDQEGVITSVNRAGCEIVGRSEQELLATPVDRCGLLDAAAWEQARRTVEAGGKARLEVDAELASGARMIGFSLTRLSDSAGVARGFLLIFQDLTEWRQLQESLRIKDRMAAVGQLAAGLAHEIGNPLAAISGAVQMLASGFPADSPRRQLLDITLRESQRLDRTIKDFLRFARPRDRELSRFDVQRLLGEHVALLRSSSEVASNHHVELELEPRHLELVADRDQISQIFWNLARNALRAMPGGGVLRVVGRRIDDTFELSVADNGRGMTERERANLFHPFQSFFDGGTGLGLAIVYRIVHEHDGKLSVISRPGEGSLFTVSLPLGGPTPRPSPAIGGPHPGEAGAGEASLAEPAATPAHSA